MQIEMMFMVHERFMVHSLVSLVVGLWFMGYGLLSLVYGLLSGLLIIFSKVKERKEEVAMAELKLTNMTRSSTSKTKTRAKTKTKIKTRQSRFYNNKKIGQDQSREGRVTVIITVIQICIGLLNHPQLFARL